MKEYIFQPKPFEESKAFTAWGRIVKFSCTKKKYNEVEQKHWCYAIYDLTDSCREGRGGGGGQLGSSGREVMSV